MNIQVYIINKKFKIFVFFNKTFQTVSFILCVSKNVCVGMCKCIENLRTRYKIYMFPLITADMPL